MKSQFDPDVWAAIFMIMIVGFGGIIFLEMFINGFVMHGIIQMFDQEVDQRCIYFLLPITSNDYYFSTESDSNFTALKNYMQINPPRRENIFNDFMKNVSKTIKGVDIGGNQKVRKICWAAGGNKEVNDEIKKCEESANLGKGTIVLLSCAVPLYGPSDVGTAEVVFLG